MFNCIVFITTHACYLIYIEYLMKFFYSIFFCVEDYVSIVKFEIFHYFTLYTCVVYSWWTESADVSMSLT